MVASLYHGNPTFKIQATMEYLQHILIIAEIDFIMNFKLTQLLIQFSKILRCLAIWKVAIL